MARAGGAPAYTTGAPGAGRRLSRFSLLLAAAFFLVSLVLLRVPLFEVLEFKTEDLRLRTRGVRPVDPHIAVIEIDEPSLKAYKNAWPFPRDQYALLVAALDGWGAKTVGIDLWFSGRDRYSDANDSLLATVTAQAPGVIHAVYFGLSMPQSDSRAAGQEAPAPDSLQDRLFRPLPPNVELMTADPTAQFDLPQVLLDEVHSLGHIGLAWGADNVSRYAPLLVEHQDRAMPALSLLMACRYLGADWKRARFESGGPFGQSRLVLQTIRGDLSIPVDDNCRALINFPGGKEVFPNRYPFIDVMHSAQYWVDGETIPTSLPQPDEFRGKVVLLCSTAEALIVADVGPTPFADNFPLAYAHASVVNSILRHDAIRNLPRGYEVVVLAAIALGLGLLLPALAPVALGLAAVGVLVGLTAFAWLMLVVFGIQMHLVPAYFLVLSLSVGIMLRAYVVRETERRAVEQELAVARKVQQDLLPKVPLDSDGVQVAGTNLPCFAVGGDYFDYFPLGDGKVALAIGDVAGKGVPAALLMSKLQATLRGECSHEVPVPEVPERANRLLMESMEGSGKFVTFFYGALDPSSRTLRYANAGHNPPMLLRAGGELELLETGGLLLGIFPHATYEEGIVTLHPGDVIVLFTDGVTEAEDRHKGQFGEDRLTRLLREARSGTAREIGDRICQEVLKFSKGLQMTDDITVVVVKVESEAASAAGAA